VFTGASSAARPRLRLSDVTEDRHGVPTRQTRFQWLLRYSSGIGAIDAAKQSAVMRTVGHSQRTRHRGHIDPPNRAHEYQSVQVKVFCVRGSDIFWAPRRRRTDETAYQVMRGWRCHRHGRRRRQTGTPTTASPLRIPMWMRSDGSTRTTRLDATRVGTASTPAAGTLLIARGRIC